VDLSGLIFVALAVAWAAYLIPKALRHHDDVVRGRSIDRFSQGLRVLARREPVSARTARLVVEPARASTAPSSDEILAARRLATSRATRRRRRVLSVVLLALVAVVALCVAGRLAGPYAAVPVGMLVVWLVACRLMVRKERAWVPAVLDETDADSGLDAEESASLSPVDPAEPAARDPELWDPVPVTLPTYVSKPPARRSVRTIDLDSTGVWTSGRTEVDSALAREAESADRERRRTGTKDTPGEQAVNS
jgi:hypothetical protein